MSAPTPPTPPAQEIVQPRREIEPGLQGSATTARRFLRTFAFQALAVLLGIALAFM